jgi:hypothetical protein
MPLKKPSKPLIFNNAAQKTSKTAHTFIKPLIFKNETAHFSNKTVHSY